MKTPIFGLSKALIKNLSQRRPGIPGEDPQEERHRWLQKKP
jgi:hypothetical protein